MSYFGNNPKMKSLVSTGATFAVLDAEPRREGRLVYATDTKLYYFDNGTDLLPLDTSSVYNLLTQDEGSDINTATVAIDFVGDGVVATDAGAGKTTVTIAGGGGGGAIIDRVQAIHGFSIMEPIYHNGTIWVAADAADGDTLAEYVVTVVTDANTFTAAKFGEHVETGIATTLTLTVGQHYLLADGGGYVATDDQTFSCPLFYVENDDTIHIEVYRPASQGAVSSPDKAFGLVVGDASDVSNGDANHSTIAAAITAASAGDRITLLPKTFTENLVITKEIHFFGSGAASVIDGTIQFSVGSERSSAEKLKFGGNITVDDLVTKLILNNGWIDNASTLTDNNALGSSASIYTLLED